MYQGWTAISNAEYLNGLRKDISQALWVLENIVGRFAAINIMLGCTALTDSGSPNDVIGSMYAVADELYSRRETVAA